MKRWLLALVVLSGLASWWTLRRESEGRRMNPAPDLETEVVGDLASEVRLEVARSEPARRVVDESTPERLTAVPVPATEAESLDTLGSDIVGLEIDVFDSVDGRRLSEVDVRIGPAMSRSRIRDDSTFGDEHASAAQPPILLVPRNDDESKYARLVVVGAPGHAWVSFQARLSDGGHRRVELPPAGDARFRIVGGVAPPDAKLELFEPGHSRAESNRLFHEGLLHTKKVGDEIQFEASSLRAGETRADLVLGKRSLLEGGAVSFGIEPGETTNVSLRLAVLDVGRESAVEGTLFVPPSWGLELEDFVLLPIGSSDVPDIVELARTGTPGLFTWTRDLEFGGEFGWCVDEIPYGRQFTVQPGSPELFALVIPEPAHLSLDFIDPRSMERADVETASILPAGAFRRSSQVLTHFSRDESTGRFEIRLAPGPTRVKAEGLAEFHAPWTEFEIMPGSNRLDVVLSQETEVELAFVGGVKVSDVSLAWTPQLIPLEGQGRMLSYSFGTLRRTFRLIEGGRYSIQFPQIVGVTFPDPLEIDVTIGEDQQHDVRLKVVR